MFSEITASCSGFATSRTVRHSCCSWRRCPLGCPAGSSSDSRRCEGASTTAEKGWERTQFAIYGNRDEKRRRNTTVLILDRHFKTRWKGDSKCLGSSNIRDSRALSVWLCCANSAAHSKSDFWTDRAELDSKTVDNKNICDFIKCFEIKRFWAFSMVPH